MRLKIKPRAQLVERGVVCPGTCCIEHRYRATPPIFWVSLLLYLQGPGQLLLTFISLPIKVEINQEFPHNLLRDAGNTRTRAHTWPQREVNLCAEVSTNSISQVMCTKDVRWRGNAVDVVVCASACVCVSLTAQR